MESKWMVRIGWVLSVLPCLMLIFSASMKLSGMPGLAEGFAHLGLPVGLAVPLGVVEVACTLIYLFPRTAVLGAILLTGYLGGAMEAHVRVGESWVVQCLLGVVLWGGLYLRDRRIRELLPVVGK